MSKYVDYSTAAFMMLHIQSSIEDHKHLSDANKLLHKLTLKGIEDTIPLLYEACRSYKDKFTEELEEGDLSDYLERQTLNFMQRAVEICLPDYNEPRAMVWLVNNIRMKGFVKDVETYLRAHEGLTSALARARYSLNGKAYSGMFAEEGDFN